MLKESFSIQTDINECASSPCLHGGTCNDQVGNYSCECTTAWAGVNCAGKNLCYHHTNYCLDLLAIEIYNIYKDDGRYM